MADITIRHYYNNNINHTIIIIIVIVIIAIITMIRRIRRGPLVRLRAIRWIRSGEDEAVPGCVACSLLHFSMYF